MFCLSDASRFFSKVLHGNKIGDSSGDDGKTGFSSQETIHYSFQNRVDIFNGDGISGYRYHTIPSLSHNPGGISILLGFSVCDYDRSGHRSQTIHLPSYNHG